MVCLASSNAGCGARTLRPECARDAGRAACLAVIEHVLDPIALLHLLRSLIAPGGFAYVVAPEASSLAHRILRSRWPYYHPDEHVNLPTLQSIERAVTPLGGRRQLRRTNMH